MIGKEFDCRSAFADAAVLVTRATSEMLPRTIPNAQKDFLGHLSARAKKKCMGATSSKKVE